MTKVCEKIYPMGSFPKQKSAGFYMEDLLKSNLDILANKIINDMDFVMVISGMGDVRTGKSVFAQQVGTYLTHKINELHKLNNTFTVQNILFKGEQLIEQGLLLPKYSVIVLDEGDDLTKAHFSKDAFSLRRFFRKCGQLNHIIILIIPDFFELPRNYAITRTLCLINVYFEDDFERGFFELYSKNRKKLLYMKGRRWGDYSVVKKDFRGWFSNLYTVDAKAYKEKKNKDLHSEDDIKIGQTPAQIIKQHKIGLLSNLPDFEVELGHEVTDKQIGVLLSASERSIRRYRKEILGFEADSGH